MVKLKTQLAIYAFIYAEISNTTLVLYSEKQITFETVRMNLLQKELYNQNWLQKYNEQVLR